MLKNELEQVKEDYRHLIAALEAKLDKFKSENKELVTKVEQITEANKHLSEKIDQNISKSNSSLQLNEWSSVVKRNIKKPTEQLTVVNAAINETIDREKRARNLVIYGVSESIGDKKEEEDKIKVVNIFKEIEAKESIIKFVKRIRAKDTSRPGPIVVGLSDVSERNPVLIAARKIRNNNKDEMKQIYFSPDMTEAQRLEDYQLRQKRNELNNSRKDTDPFRYAIRGNQIVKFRINSLTVNNQ